MEFGYGYARYSSHMQDEKSIEQQKMEIEEYAQRNNIKIVQYYTDEAKTGTKNDRDGFRNMISDACKNKDIKYILVWKTDRFARNTQDSILFRNKLKKHNTKLVSISQPIDDSTPEGQLMSTMLAGMDEYYSQNLASNVRRAQKQKAKNYEFNGGIAPLGFDVVDKHYVINEKEAEIVKKIYSLYLNGYGLLDIASKLNELGYKTKRGNSFGKNSIYEILSNEKYIGTYTFNKAYRHDRHTKREDTIIIEDVIPSIISKEDFNRVKEIRSSHKKTGGKYSAKTVYLLSGLIVCGKCGANYTGRTSTKTKNTKTYKTGYYICGNRNKLGKCTNHILKKEELEQAIINLLKDKLINGVDIDTLALKVNEEYKKLHDSNDEYRKQIKEEIKEKEKQINNLSIAIMEGIKSPTIVNKINELEDVLSVLREELRFANNIDNVPQIDANLIKGMLKKDTNTLAINNESREILKKWIKKIEVLDNEIIVHFSIDNSSSSYLVAGVRNIIRLRIDLQNISTCI